MLCKPVAASLVGWLCLLNAGAWGQFSGGSGTGVDPYLISDPNALQAIGLNSVHWDKHFRLTGDLDLTGVAMTVIGNLATNFTGTFKGGGNIIANLNINLPSSDYVGLFGIVDNGVDPNTIFNLGLIDLDITGGNRVGGLVGFLKNGTVSGCSSTGQVSVTGSPGGGLVGLNHGTVSQCSSTSSVSGTTFIGGLVGWNNIGTISDSSTGGQANGTNSVGGLVGLNNGTVSQCDSTSSADGIFYVGGLVGYNLNGMIIESYAMGSVVGTNSQVGGLAGVNDNGTIGDSYAMGAVNGFRQVGGLVGRNYKATISHSYAIGSVNGTTDVGGLVGIKVAGTVSHSFWDMETSGQASSAGGTGQTTAQMRMGSTYVCWETLELWTIDEGVEPPHLLWEGSPGGPMSLPTYGGGSGDPNNPYLIASAGDLLDLSLTSCDWDKHFRLIFDSNMAGIVFTPIGTVGIPFTGTFDGGGYIIANLNINLPVSDYVGLFGYVDNEVDPNTIFNLGLIDPNIIGNNYVGGLAGFLNNGTFTACGVSGQVIGDERVGGLVGENHGTISGSYFTGRVTGTTWYIGGLVGYDGYHIKDCYAIGLVEGIDSIGNLVGLLVGGTVSQSYAAGEINGTTHVGGLVGKNDSGVIEDSFWDQETGDPNNMCGSQVNGGTGCDNSYGKMTALMQDPNTFLSAGWDFVGESANGADDIWRMCLGGLDYPRLTWEYVGIGDFVCPDGVGMGDWVLFTNWWGATNCTAGNNWCEGADFDQSGTVDLVDALVFFGNWLSGI